MSLGLRLSRTGNLQMWAGERMLISNLDLDIQRRVTESAGKDALQASPWEWLDGTSRGEVCQHLRRVVQKSDSPLLTAEIRLDQNVATFTVTVEQTLTKLHVGDTFEAFSVAFPRMTVPDCYRCFLTTYGLGPSGNGGVGGYWPEAMVVDSTEDLPSQAFAPVVLFGEAGALAIAPTSQFLTSMLLRDGNDIVRTLHGSVDSIGGGMRIETMFAWGEDITTALLNAGDVLLSRGGKTRPDPHGCILTSKLGWWNAYGGYYTEPIHPLDGSALMNQIESLGDQGVPVAYLGLDLWYPYKYIGQALRFAPDPSKYPDGIGSISEHFDLPTVLHLSALAEENEYQANGSDPAFYRHVAKELRKQGAVVAWHDWLRTQQHLSPALRRDSIAADAWFGGMAQAMADEGISVLTCMHTMGMVLRSTTLPNVISARSSIDYLFAQSEALDTLEKLGLGGFKAEATPLPVMRRQNLLVGFTYYALGLLPFYDLFLTRWQDDVGGISPRAEAVLRALSCGPIGIGDGPGMTDVDLVNSLVSQAGDLLQPDHPPYPDSASLGQAIEVFRTERRAGSATWNYIVALNTTSAEQPFDLSAPTADCIIWDGIRQQAVDCMQGILPAGEIAYYVLAPMAGGIAPIGLWNKTVPAPAHVVHDAQYRDGWTIKVDAKHEIFATWAPAPIVIKDQDGRELPQEMNGPFVLTMLGEGVSSLHIARR